MSKRIQDRLGQEVKQIQTLFKDFKKMLNKCRELAQQLRVELPNDSLYSSMERTIPMKVNLLDINGLVNLKNSIAKTTSELFDQERQFAYRKEKKQVKEKMDRLTVKRKDSTEKPKETSSHSKGNTVSERRTEDSLQSMRTSRSSEMRQSKSIEIPIYKAKVETAEGKMDRISKYIASLKKNIKANADAAGSKWRVRDYLLGEPTYLKAKTLLQRYLMRQEEIDRVVQEAVKVKLLEYFNQSQDVTKDEIFYYVKVKKPQTSNKILPIENQSPQKTLEKASANNTPNVQASVSPAVQKQATQDFQQMKAELEKRNQNYAQMFSKMNEDVERGSERLNQIRQKRKQAFQQDDELWDEL